MFEEQDWLKIKRSIQDSAWGKKKAGWQKKRFWKMCKIVQCSCGDAHTGQKLLNTR